MGKTPGKITARFRRRRMPPSEFLSVGLPPRLVTAIGKDAAEGLVHAHRALAKRKLDPAMRAEYAAALRALLARMQQ